jgi:hypothetical protein
MDPQSDDDEQASMSSAREWKFGLFDCLQITDYVIIKLYL